MSFQVPPGYQSWQPAQPPTAQPSGAGPVLLSIGTVSVGIWIVATTAFAQVVAFVGASIGGFGATDPVRFWVLMAAIHTLLVVAPAGLIWLLAALFSKQQPGVQAAARAWTLAGLTGGGLSALRAIAPSQNEILLLATAAVIPLMVLAWFVQFRRPKRLAMDTTGSPSAPLSTFALALGLVVLLPWLWIGGLGGWSESILAVLAAASFGWLAGATLTRSFFDSFGRSRAWRVLVGGSAAGVALVPMAAGLGGRGINVAELVILPALGFTAAALTATGRTGRTPIGILLGAAALGPLAFLDPGEVVSLWPMNGDIGLWALIGTLISLGAALVVGVITGVGLSPRWRPSRLVSTATALVVLAAGVAVYTVAGRPGLYGERLLVMMVDQPDLTGLETIADRPTRLKTTYARLREHAEATQAPLRAALDERGLDYTPYYLVNAVLVDGGPITRRWLEGRSDVDRVLLDERLRPLPAQPAGGYERSAGPVDEPPWNITEIEADRVWSEFGVRGEGIVVGTSDSGVDGTHRDLSGSFRGGDDSWFDPWNATTTPTDHDGHGTHTIATAVGGGGIGVAPGAQWIGCVNLGRNLGSPSLYLDCMQFMLAPFPTGGDPWLDGRPERAPHILTNSWGCPDIEGCDVNALRPATAAFAAAGIYVVVAAGNTGPNCATVSDAPAPYEDVMTVGASDTFGYVASFSSRGPGPATGDGGDRAVKPDVLAPGVHILSALPGNSYGFLDGTSMAAPHIAGVVALLWSAKPSLIGDIEATSTLLRTSTTPIGPGPRTQPTACGEPANITGAGQVDAFFAVRTALTAR